MSYMARRFCKPACGCASGPVSAGVLGRFRAVVPAASGPVPAAASRPLQAGASGLEAPRGSTRMQGFIFMGACFRVLSATAPITAGILNASVFFVFCFLLLALLLLIKPAEPPLFSPLSSSLLPFLPSRKPIDSLIGLPCVRRG